MAGGVETAGVLERGDLETLCISALHKQALPLSLPPCLEWFLEEQFILQLPLQDVKRQGHALEVLIQIITLLLADGVSSPSTLQQLEHNECLEAVLSHTFAPRPATLPTLPQDIDLVTQSSSSSSAQVLTLLVEHLETAGHIKYAASPPPKMRI